MTVSEIKNAISKLDESELKEIASVIDDILSKNKNRSGSDIFGMLKHRKTVHPVSIDDMNEAIRKRRYDSV